MNEKTDDTEDWYIVSSQIGKDVDGFPIGVYLCKSLSEVSDCIFSKRISHPMINKYKQEPVKGTIDC